jgi:hypothetical protein
MTDLLPLLRSLRCLAANESDLQDGLAALLVKADIQFDREVRLAPGEIIDFLVGRTGIECKVDGAMHDVLRQLGRYSESDRIDSLILLTTRRQHVASLPKTLQRKWLTGVFIGAGL